VAVLLQVYKYSAASKSPSSEEVHVCKVLEVSHREVLELQGYPNHVFVVIGLFKTTFHTHIEHPLVVLQYLHP